MSGVVKAVAYVRVSTDEQDPKGQALVLESYAQERGYKIVEWFRDEGVSGSVDPLERPGFRELLDYVQAYNVDVVLVYDLTRFYRAPSPTQALERLRELMDRYGILIEFAREPEIEDPLLRELWMFIKSWFATYERLQISLRTKYGIAKVKKEGRLYHKPTLAHYYASVLFGKKLGELSREEVALAQRKLREIVSKYWEDPAIKKTELWRVLSRAELKELYERYPDAPKSYLTFYRIMKGEA